VSVRGNRSAIVYCEGSFESTNGKTAHGLVRFTRRYTVASVVDSEVSGRDAGEVLDGRANGIPILPSVAAAVEQARASGQPATHLVIGLAPDGGRLSERGRIDVRGALELGLNVDSGLHDYLSEDPAMAEIAERRGCRLRDIRKPPPRDTLHFFSGRIEEVKAFKVALLGTDSAVGKRTTAWRLIEALEAGGHPAQMVGTGQTAWLQGAKPCIILDSLVNDFVSGEIEHAVWSAWTDGRPEFIVIEGQGSLMNPAYPGGFEILAAGRPDVVVLQHAPGRKEYDGFPGYRLHPLRQQIDAIELISGKPVVAITVNHESLPRHVVPAVCEEIFLQTGLPSCDVLLQGPDELLGAVMRSWHSRRTVAC
jgi:uncharacterized NAD-dependent epimerase/dehydratase family protein